MGRLALKRSAGMGSRGQDLMGDFLMRSWTSPVVSGVKSDSVDVARGSGKRSEKVAAKQCMRTMLLCNTRSRIIEMHKDLNLLNIEKRQNLHLSMDCFTHMNNKDSSLNKYFKTRPTRRIRVGETQLELSKLRTTTGRNAFSYRGPQH